MTNQIRTAVIDDHSMIREGIVNLLEREDEIDIVAQGANGQEAIEIVKRA